LNAKQDENVKIVKTGTTASPNNGGGIYAYDVTDLYISDVTFEGLHADDNGGAIYAKGENRNTKLSIYGSTFTNNKVFFNPDESSDDPAKGYGAGIYYAGDDAKKYEHEFYTSFYLTTSAVNKFEGNESKKSGEAIYLKNITKDSSIKYTQVLSTGNHEIVPANAIRNILSYTDSPAKLTMTNTKFANLVLWTTTNVKNYSVMYVDNSTVELGAGFSISTSSNPIRLKKATLSMTSYDFRNHMADGLASGVPVDEDILIYGNKDEYIIGVDASEISNIYLKQGMIYNNTSLLGANRYGYDVTSAGIYHDGMMGYIVDDTSNIKQSNIYVGGNLHVKNNLRETAPRGSNMPLEIVPDGQRFDNPHYRHFNVLISDIATESFVENTEMTKLKDGVEDVRIGRNAKVYFSAINTEADTSVGGNAKVSPMFKMQNEDVDYIRFNNRFIQGYENGTGGAVSSAMFFLDSFGMNVKDKNGNDVYDNRVVFFDQGGSETDPERIYVKDTAQLIEFNFEMVFDTADHGGEWVQAIDSQRVSQGSYVIRPIKDYSIAEDTSATIYTNTKHYKVIDIIGNLDFDGTKPNLRFHSWDWKTEVRREPGSTWSPQLICIYAVTNHEHKSCGTSNDYDCNHLGVNNSNAHAEFGGDVTGAEKEKTCVDVRIPEQLYYAAEHPEYMYVLGADIEITDTLRGLDTDKILNDKDNPVQGLKLCLNGHKITVKSKKDFFALYGDCIITDCQSRHGTIEYATPSEVTDGSLFTLVNKNSSINSFGIYGKQDEEIEFKNVAINNTNQAFVKGFKYLDELHLEYVSFRDNDLKSSLFETKGSTMLDHVKLLYNKFDCEGKSIISMQEPATDNDTYNHGDYMLRSGVYGGNVLNSKDSSIIDIKAKDSNSTILLENDENITSEDAKIKVGANDISNRAVFAIGHDQVSKALFTVRGLDCWDNEINTGISGIDEYKGGVLYLKNIYGNSETGSYSINNCEFQYCGIDTVVASEESRKDLNYTRDTGTYKMRGGAIYIEGTTAGAPVNQTNQLTINDCKFHNNVAYEGGAIYLKNSRGIILSGDSTEANKNYAYEGSVLYVNDSDASISGKTSVDIHYLQGREMYYNGIVFKNNDWDIADSVSDDIKSKSMIYFTSIGTDDEGKPVTLNVESPRVQYNYASDGLYKLGKCDYTNLLKFYGEDANGYIRYNGLYTGESRGEAPTEHYGGPVIAFADNAQVELFESAEGRQLNIDVNDVGNKSAVVKADTASVSIALLGKFTIRDNFTDFSDPKQANVQVSPGMTFAADDSLDSANTFIYFNTKVTDTEMPIIKWNFNINCANNPGIEHFYADNKAPVTTGHDYYETDAISAGTQLHIKNATDTSYAVYKGNDSGLFVGNVESFAKPIYAIGNYKLLTGELALDSDEGKASLALYGQKGAEIQFDQYTLADLGARGSRTKVFNGFEKWTTAPEGTGWEAKDGYKYYVGKTSVGEYRTWGFIGNEDNFVTNTYKVGDDTELEHLDYIWVTQHTGHTNYVSAHGMFNSDWIVAYDESFLHSTYPSSYGLSDLNEPGVTSVDVVLTDKRQLTLKKAITKVEGMNICLNGNTIYAPDNDNLVRLESTTEDNIDEGTSKVLALMNCQDAGEVKGTTVTHNPIFNLIGSSNISPSNEATLYLENIKIGGFNYTGDEDGSIVKASYSNVHFINTTIDGASSTFNAKTPIMLGNSNVAVRGFDSTSGGLVVTGVGNSSIPDIGANGFFYMYGGETFYNQETSRQEIRNKFLGDVRIQKVVNNRFISDKAFFNLEDVYGASDGAVNVYVGFDGVTDMIPSVSNQKDKAKGGLFYLSFPHDDGTTERTFNLNRIDSFYIGTETKGYGSFVYVEDFKSNLKDGYFNLNVKGTMLKTKAKYDGGAFYFNTTGEYDARLNLNIDFGTDSAGSNVSETGSGGFVYINQENWNESYKRKNKLNIRTSSHDEQLYILTGSAGKNGGVFYITDTIFDATDGIIYAATLNPITAGEEGGFLWQKRSITTFKNLQIKYAKSTGAGAAIYVDGSDGVIGDTTDQLTQKHDSITLGKVGSGLTRISITHNNESTNKKGIVVIGTYSDLFLGGEVKMWDGENYNNHTDNTEVLYVRGEGLDAETLSNYGVRREVLSNFVPTTDLTDIRSYIYGKVERMDKMLFSGWNITTHPNYKNTIAPSSRYYDAAHTKEMNVYDSGAAAHANIHIGYTDARIRFITTIAGDSSKVKTFREDIGVSMGSTKLLTVTYDELKSQAISVSGKNESEFLGFVAHQSNSSGTIKRIGSYIPDDPSSTDPHAFLYIANPENYVMAVWKDTGDAPDIKFADGTYAETGLVHTNPTTWVKTEFVEQLYFDDSSLSLGYKLAQDLYDGWTVIDSGDNASGYTVKASGSIAEPITNSTEYIYMAGHDFYKQWNAPLYVNTSGTIGLFNNDTEEDSHIITKTTETFELMTQDFINAYSAEIIGNIKVKDLVSDYADSAIINTSEADGGLYILGNVEFVNNANLRLKPSKNGSTYIMDAMFDGNKSGMPTGNYSNAMIYFASPDPVNPSIGNALIKRTTFKNNTLNSIVELGGDYNDTIAEGILTIDSSVFTGNRVFDVATDSAMIKILNSSSKFEQTVFINDTKFINNNDTDLEDGETYYHSIIKSYGHAVYLDGVTIKDNKVQEYILSQYKADGLGMMRYMLANTVIENNELTYSTTTKDYVKGIVLYQDYADQSLMGTNARSVNLIGSTSIVGNKTNAAVYNSDVRGIGNPMCYAFGGLVNITGNTDRSNQEVNFVVKDSYHDDSYDEAHTVTFVKTGSEYFDAVGYISSRSTIGVRVDADWVSTDVAKYIACSSWVYDERPLGATYQIFESDHANYITAKSGTSIVLMRKEDTDKYITTMFEPYDDSVSIKPQYIMYGVDTVADEPMRPVSTIDPSAVFEYWCQDKNLISQYLFNDSGTPVEGEGSPKIATIYGLWKRDLTVTIVTNNGGKGIDGTVFPPVMLDVDNVASGSFTVPMGKPLSEST
ncbi:MAG: hypothetical protein IKP66_07905, partial [Lachnospiraceae bacterium]|nr:hypothetical protein [Lachnospiraceae bacterium]